LAKRISDISKELGVPSKAIIQKCLDEGVPAEKVKGHASTVSAGLEQSIRDWFSTAGDSMTAVETKEHVDVTKLRAAPAAKGHHKKHGSDHDDGHGAPSGANTATAEHPVTPDDSPAPAAPPASPAGADGPGRPSIKPARPVEVLPPLGTIVQAAPPKPVAPPPKPVAPALPTSPIPTTPHAPATPIKPTPIAPPAPMATTGLFGSNRAGGSRQSRPSEPPKPVAPAVPVKTPEPELPPLGTVVQAAPPRPVAPPPAPVSRAPVAGGSAVPVRPGAAGPSVGGAVRPVGPGGPSAPGGPVGQGVGPGGSTVPPHLRGPQRPAQPNVPVRPKLVLPAGQALQKTKVELKGPTVVRIEAAEVLPERRGPRPGGGGSFGGPGQRAGRGIISSGPGGAATDDRNARRNTRRKIGPGAGPAGPAGVPAKRKIRETSDELSTEGRTGFTEADVAAREERLARSSGYLKQRRREERARLDAQGRRVEDVSEGKVEIAEPFTIKDLSAATGVKAADIIKKLFMQGVMATVNSGIDSAKAQEIMIDFDIELVVIEAKTAEEEMTDELAARVRVDERPRAAVVTIMGHVDHGKTSLLDAIRNANVAAGEAGGITQKTSAFKVDLEVAGEKRQVVFIDTPGHEAFTEMRSRGANVTDVVVLVVGAPEGVMPQTVESINHAKAAEAQIVVALNKIDSPQATEGQVQKVYGQLAEQGLNPVAWGGTTEVIHTSALKKTGINELLEVLDLQSQVLELKADFGGPAAGRVIEASLTEGRGAVATILVQEGELNVGDFIVAGRAFGRVRDITDDKGKRIKTAGPSTPVQISGLDEVPAAGDAFFVTDSLVQAEDAAQQRRDSDRALQLHQPKVTLDSIFSQMKDADVKEILVVLKADVQGSIDAISTQVEKLSTAEVKVRVLHKAVGGITESDVVLAEASKAVVVGFNVIPSGKARQMADNKGVEIRTYQVIYDILDDVRKAASGLLEPEIRQEVLGHAEVRKVFNVSKVGTIAGCYVTDGLVQRDALIRVTRNGVIVVNDRVLEQLKRFKDDAKDVKANMECGMKIVGYDDIKEGDVLECYKKVEIKRTL
jgi:translation initiation factor IF-2